MKRRNIRIIIKLNSVVILMYLIILGIIGINVYKRNKTAKQNA